jgi:hypothetical protein
MVKAGRVRSLQARAITCIAALIFLAGCEVRTPGTLETRLIQSTKRRLTIGGRSDVNPLPATSDNVERGQKTFGAYCMVCHGLDGQNTGVPFADKMSPPVPPLQCSHIPTGSCTGSFRTEFPHRECLPQKMFSVMRRSGSWCCISGICRRREVSGSRRFMAEERLRR